MDKEKLEQFRRRLEEERASILDEMRLLREEVTDSRPSEMSHAPSHLADLSSDDHDVGVSIKGLERGSEELAWIVEALRRMDEGKFGICEECGRDVSPGRLEALPYVALCIECKRNQERERPAY